MELSKKKMVYVRPGELTVGLSDVDVIHSLQYIDKVKTERAKQYHYEDPDTLLWLQHRTNWLTQKFRVLNQNAKL